MLHSGYSKLEKFPLFFLTKQFQGSVLAVFPQLTWEPVLQPGVAVGED